MKYLLSFTVIILLSLSSCREDIINPQNTGGNINEPVAVSTGSAYIFSINGENISYTVDYSPNLSSTNNYVYLNLTNYTSGGIVITVYNPGGSTIFSNGINNNVDNNTFAIFAQDVNKIQFSFVNFTGKFRFEIAPIN